MSISHGKVRGGRNEDTGRTCLQDVLCVLLSLFSDSPARGTRTEHLTCHFLNFLHRLVRQKGINWIDSWLNCEFLMRVTCDYITLWAAHILISRLRPNYCRLWTSTPPSLLRVVAAEQFKHFVVYVIWVATAARIFRTFLTILAVVDQSYIWVRYDTILFRGELNTACWQQNNIYVTESHQ